MRCCCRGKGVVVEGFVGGALAYLAVVVISSNELAVERLLSDSQP